MNLKNMFTKGVAKTLELIKVVTNIKVVM